MASLGVIGRRLLSRTALAGAATVGMAAALTLPAESAGATPTTWTVAPSPNPGGADQFGGISCVGPEFCMAVGNFGGQDGTVAERWNGSSWTGAHAISPGGDPDQLFGVSCISASFCMAVGWYDDISSGVYSTLIERWNGSSWSITPSDSPTLQNVLYGVKCESSTRCQAVGYDLGGSGDTTLVESWNGTSWAIVSSPNEGGQDSELQGVTCTGPNACVAVGWYEGVYGELTLVESWNGSTWSVVSSPSPGTTGNNLFLGVSCPMANSCVAVGAYSVGAGPDRTLVEDWNGHSWIVVSSPNRGSGANDLAAVSCTSSSNCVAVGYHLNPSGDYKTLIESETGSTWSTATSPNPGADDQLLGLACTSADSCQAVGYYSAGSLISDKTLVESGSGG